MYGVRFKHIVFSTVAAAILTACGSSKSTVGVVGYEKSYPAWPKEEKTADLPVQSKKLLSSAHEWLGVPYKYGGNDHKGVDCSGLVVRVYNDALGISLPRTSREQYDQCTPVSKGNLIPGDLIFYATGSKRDEISHVGIYLGEDLMIHASASKGVILSDINGEYFLRRFVGSGMVGQYHAMIESVPKDKIDTQLSPILTTKASFDTEISFTTVDKLPEKGAQVEVNNESSPKTIAQQSVVQQGAQSATNVQKSSAKIEPIKVASGSHPEQSAEEARAAVLNSLKEKDL